MSQPFRSKGGRTHSDSRKLEGMERCLKAYILAGQDLALASRACQLTRTLAPEESDPDYYFASLAVVVCYARPFSGNRPYVELPKRCTAFLMTRQADAHATALKLRKEVYAHSDAAVRNVEITPDGADVYTNGTEVEIRQRFKVRTTHPAFPSTMLTDLENASWFIRGKLHEEIVELRDQVHALKGRPLETFEIGKAASD